MKISTIKHSVALKLFLFLAKYTLLYKITIFSRSLAWSRLSLYVYHKEVWLDFPNVGCLKLVNHRTMTPFKIRHLNNTEYRQMNRQDVTYVFKS